MKRDMGLEKLLAGIGSVQVHSQADGNMTVMVYRRGADSLPGVDSRMDIANEFERVIQDRINRAKAAFVREKA